MVDRLGNWMVSKLRELASIIMLPYAAFKGAVMEHNHGRGLIRSSTAAQVYFTAIEPMPIFLLIAVTSGFFVITLSDFLMRPNGLAPHVPTVIAHSIVREVVPLIIALILIGRSGTAIATELGYMRVNHEIDALDVAGVNTDYFLVLPRLIGVTMATITLTVTMSASAIVGGFALGEGLNLISVGLRFEQILRSITFATIAFALIKATLFGMVIAAVNCFHGLAVGRSFTEIPRANVRGAMQCYLTCFVMNAVITVYALADLL